MLLSLPLQAKRIALVMGNDNYTSVSKLQKAGNDATAMARELKSAGFTVQLHKDLNYRGMVRAVEAFTNNITGGDEVVVFFAGHGVQIKNGSYLLPTDIEASSESEVEKTAYELLALTDKISEAKPAFSLVMVDACRDNPLKSRGRSVGNARGLSAIEPPKGQMVVYSASRGQQALDRLSDKDPNPNGVFTREFITQMQKPGVRIEDIMRGVQDSVETLAKTVNHDQRPAVYNEARGNFYFFGPAIVQVPLTISVSKLEEQKEEKFWEDSKAIGNKDAFEAYLLIYPNGRFANLAKANVRKFNEINHSSFIKRTPPSSATEETKRLFKKAYEENNFGSQAELAFLYEKGQGGLLKDESEALKLYRLAADQGIADAQAGLAFLTEKGIAGLVKDEVEALRLYQMAASRGSARAQNNLGVLYQTGRAGLIKNEVEALRLYRLAVAQGSAQAQANLGVLYKNGRAGLTKDEIEALRYFRLAAGKGNALGQHELGLFYRDGLGGLTKNETEALKYFRLSAAQDNAAAQNSLGIFHRLGRAGLEKNDSEAVRLYRLSAGQGNASAQFNLGFLYDKGLAGLPKDEVQALSLYKSSASNGNLNAIKRLKEIEGSESLPALEISNNKTEKIDTTNLPRANVTPGSCPKPEYPSSSRRLNEEGVVTIKFLIDPEGRAQSYEIVQSSGFKALDQAAVTSLKECKFIPATRDGKNTAGWSSLKYTWRLN